MVYTIDPASQSRKLREISGDPDPFRLLNRSSDQRFGPKAGGGVKLIVRDLHRYSACRPSLQDIQDFGKRTIPPAQMGLVCSRILTVINGQTIVRQSPS